MNITECLAQVEEFLRCDCDPAVVDLDFCVRLEWSVSITGVGKEVVFEATVDDGRRSFYGRTFEEAFQRLKEYYNGLEPEPPEEIIE
jgi:hypothetical protein